MNNDPLITILIKIITVIHNNFKLMYNRDILKMTGIIHVYYVYINFDIPLLCH